MNDIQKAALYQDVIELAARGYTVRTIKAMLEEAYPALQSEHLPDALVTQWILECGSELRQARDIQEKFTTEHVGLARKLVRIQRLAEFAESIEKKAGTDVRWAGEYRRAIGDIDRLCEGTTIKFDISDSWVKLLQEVARVGSTASLEQGNLAPTPEDSGIIVDLTDTVTIPDSAERQAAKADLRRGA